MASGDQTLCAEVQQFFGSEVETVQVKQAFGRMAAECLPPAISTRLIEEAAERSIKKNGGIPKPFKVESPILMAVEFAQSDMADRAALMPQARRAADRRVEYTAGDMITIYHAFRTLLALAR